MQKGIKRESGEYGCLPTADKLPTEDALLGMGQSGVLCCTGGIRVRGEGAPKEEKSAVRAAGSGSCRE